MATDYPILNIQPEWVSEKEALGSKEKFWYKDPAGGNLWLYKYPEVNTGQHWAEKIAAEVAREMGIAHAAVELAIFQGVQGSSTLSFIDGGRNLFHGNQILAGQVLGYNPQKQFKQSSHTLHNIFRSLDSTFLDGDASKRAKIRFVEYLVFDAVIGNTDRHHENWGILSIQRENDSMGRLSPTFDHASSLGRELRDSDATKTRQRYLAENRIGAYSEKGNGAIYWEETDKHGLSPLELVRRGNAEYPDFFQPALNKIKDFDKSTFEAIINRIPKDWMSDLSRRFALELMCYNITRLRELIP